MPHDPHAHDLIREQTQRIDALERKLAALVAAPVMPSETQSEEVHPEIVAMIGVVDKAVDRIRAELADIRHELATRGA